MKEVPTKISKNKVRLVSSFGGCQGEDPEII